MTNKTADLLGSIALPLQSGDFFVVYRTADGVLTHVTYQNLLALLATALSAYPKGQIFGLTLSAAGATATFGIAAGQATDSTAVATLTLGSAYTKTTGPWSVGTGNGALDTGSIAANTWYHAYAIQRPDTLVVDVIVSTNASAPSLPASYTLYRRIGSILTDGSSQWVKFVQLGDTFLWDAMVADLVNQPTSNTPALRALTVPAGISTEAIFTVTAQDTNTNTDITLVVSSPLVSSPTPAVGKGILIGAATTVGGSTIGAAMARIVTDTSRQVRTSSQVTGNLWLSTVGWVDRRGRDA